MQIMVIRHERRARNTNPFSRPLPLIPLVVPGSDEYIFKEIWIVHVQLVRVDPHDWSVLLVQIADFPHVLATEDYIVVELVPEGGDGEFWAREVGDRAEVEAADDKDGEVCCPNEDSGEECLE